MAWKTKGLNKQRQMRRARTFSGLSGAPWVVLGDASDDFEDSSLSQQPVQGVHLSTAQRTKHPQTLQTERHTSLYTEHVQNDSFAQSVCLYDAVLVILSCLSKHRPKLYGCFFALDLL